MPGTARAAHSDTVCAVTHDVPPDLRGEPDPRQRWLAEGARLLDNGGGRYVWTATVPGLGEVYHRLDGPAIIAYDYYGPGQHRYTFCIRGSRTLFRTERLLELYLSGRSDTLHLALKLWNPDSITTPEAADQLLDVVCSTDL